MTTMPRPVVDDELDPVIVLIPDLRRGIDGRVARIAPPMTSRRSSFRSPQPS